MFNKPTVSVIVPNFNHADFLSQRVDSILEQTYTDYEIILLDDLSVDHSTTIFNNYKDHPKVSKYIINTKNSGSPFKQWLKGINLANGDYIWIAESDDFADSHFLEKTVSCIRKNPKSSLVYTDSKIVDANGVTKRLWKDDKNDFFHTNRWNKDYSVDGIEEIQNYLFYRTTINNASAVLFKKEILMNKYFQNNIVNFNNAGDLFTYLFASTKGKISYIHEPLNNYRIHKNNITAANRKNGKIFKERLNCFTVFLKTNPFTNIDNNSIRNLESASDFILKKNAYEAIRIGELNKVLNFIKVLKQNKIYSIKKTIILHNLFKANASKVILVSLISKKILKKYFFKNLKYS